jgi:gliding motility-associated-like protein
MLVLVACLGWTQTVQISVTNGSEIRCVSDSIVMIEITPNINDSWQEIRLFWGDGSEQMLQPGDTLVHTHIFSTSQFVEDCRDYDCLFTNGFCFQLSVIVVYENIPDENVQKILTFKIPPQVNFTFSPAPPCVDEEVCFENLTCPGNDDLMIYSWDIAGLAISNEADTCYSFDAAGSYPVTLIAENDCGLDEITRTINVIPPPIASITPEFGFIDLLADTLTVCIDQVDTVLLHGIASSNESSYNWTISPPGFDLISDSDSSYMILSFIEEGLYLIQLTVDNSCDQPDIDTIFVNAVSNSSLQLEDQEDACLSLTYTPSTINQGATYTLNGIILAVDTFPIDLDPGIYTVGIMLESPCGNQSVFDTFTVFQAEDVEILNPVSDTSVCTGSDAFPLIASHSDGQWLVNGIPGTAFFQSNDVGIYLVEYVRGEGICERRDTITITVQGPTAMIEPISLCRMNPGGVPLLANPFGGTWTSPECPTCIENDSFFIERFIGDPPLTVHYTISDNIGCSFTTVSVLNIDQPISNFTIDGPPCSGMPIDINSQGSIGDVLTWFADGVQSSLPITLSPGQHEIVLVSSIGVCSDSSSIELNILSPPASASFSANESGDCSPIAVVFTPDVPFDTNNMYVWTFEGGSVASSDMYFPDTVIFENMTEEPRTFEVSLSVSNLCGIVEQSMEISVLTEPVAELGLDSVDSGCSPYTVTLTNRSTGVPEVCHWTFGNGSTATDCEPFHTQTYFAADSTTYYDVILDVENSCGMSTDTISIAVLPADVDAFFNISDPVVCANTLVEFIDASTPIPSQIAWKVRDEMGNIIHINNDPNFSFEFPEANATYEITLQASGGCGSDTISHFVNTLSEPIADFELPAITCAGEIFVRNLSPDDYLKYIWLVNGDTVAMDQFNLNYTLDPSPITEISLIVSDFDHACPNTITKSIEVREPLIIDFDVMGERTGCTGLEVQFINQSENANSFLWDFGNGTISSLENPTTLFQTGSFSIVLVASDGICIDTFSREGFVQIEDCKVYIPTSFSPNEDGTNDLFTVYAGDYVDQLNYLRIFSSWGDMVFEQEDIILTGTEGWDGSLNGKPLNPDVFIYITEILYEDGSTEVRIGDVTLVR